jgi:Beta-propeller repeat
MYFARTKRFLSLLLCTAVFSASAKETGTPAVGSGLRKPLCFMENKGQVVDLNGNPRRDVQFKLAAGNFNLYVSNNQLHYQFLKWEKKSEKSGHIAATQLDVTLLQANLSAPTIEEAEIPYFENYFLGTGSGVTAHGYEKITFQNVYPNIDWCIYVKDGKVEYDFKVHPGGNVKNIRMQYDGFDKLNLSDNGTLSAATSFGKIEEKKPFSYLEKTGKEVASSFRLTNNVLSFDAVVPQGETLVIDPFISWSTYFGGAGVDVATAITSTATSQVYVAGYTASTGLGTLGTSYPAYLTGTYNAFLASYNATGGLAWATYFGGGGDDEATGVAVDALGNIYITGTSTGSLWAGTTSQPANAGGYDAFLVQFNNTGVMQWSTYFGGTGDDKAFAITSDIYNNVYIAGQTSSNAGIIFGGAFSSVLLGATDGFIAKFTNTGTLAYGSYFGGSGQDMINAIASDQYGNIAFTGQTTSDNIIATSTAHQPSRGGAKDAFVQFFSSTGGQLWGTYFGGTGDEEGNGIVFDAQNNIAIIGNTSSSSAITANRPWQPIYGGGMQDAFIAYYTSNGRIKWSTYYGGNGDDYGQGICLDPNYNFAVTGMTYSTSGISGNSGFQLTNGGDYDAYISKFDTLGRMIWGSYFGSTFYDYSYAVTCDANNQLTIAGYTNDGSGIATPGAQQTTIGGGVTGGLNDAFIARIAQDTNVLIVQPFTDTVVCAGDTLFVAYHTSYNFQASNQFVVQLSDNTGSFATPTTIGIITANTTGTVPCVIPAGTPLGSGYRIRIFGTNPITFSPDDYKNIKVVSNVAAIGAAVVQGSTPVCVGANISMLVTAPYSIFSLNWWGPAAFTSASLTPVITSCTFADSGWYYVSIVHNGCARFTDSIHIQVNNFTPPTPTDSIGPSVCAGFNLYLFANPDTIASPIGYLWTGPAGFTSTLKNPVIPSITAANAGTYYLMDTVGGCPSMQDVINIALLPIVPASVAIDVTPSNTTVCKGTNVSFTTVPVNSGTSPVYQWYAGSPAVPVVGASFNNYASPYFSNGEQIYCVMNSSIPCAFPISATSNVITLTVLDNTPTTYIVATPDSVVAPGQNITFTDFVTNPGTIMTYQWRINGINVPGANSNTFTLSYVNSHVVVDCQVFTNANCANPDNAFSNAIGTHTTTSVNTVASPLDNIFALPNPNTGVFELRGAMPDYQEATVAVQIVNAIGQVIQSENIAVSGGQVSGSFDLSGVADGIYTLRVAGAGFTKVIRILVAGK